MYVIVVKPGAMALTVPVVLIVAIADALLVHVPPVGDDDKDEVSPVQVNNDPDIVAGDGLTVTGIDAIHPARV